MTGVLVPTATGDPVVPCALIAQPSAVRVGDAANAHAAATNDATNRTITVRKCRISSPL